jgi:hypothetical protein
MVSAEVNLAAAEYRRNDPLDITDGLRSQTGNNTRKRTGAKKRGGEPGNVDGE